MNAINLTLRNIIRVVFVVALSATLLTAQQNRGTLRGLVADEFGAALVGATVTLIDESGAQKNTTSNGEGIYIFNGLAPGKYFVQASAKGFATSDAAEVNLTAGQRQSLD